MKIGLTNNELQRVPIRKPISGYYLRWFYNGWHYWFFLPGKITMSTEGEKYRTLGTRKLTMSTGQVSLPESMAIRTIFNAREVSQYTDNGWAPIRIEPSNPVIKGNIVTGYEFDFTAIVGNRAASKSGYSPVTVVPIIPPAEQCETIIGSQIWMCKNWDGAFPGSKVYNNNEVNRSIYGGLYTYSQVMSPGFCPIGWHVPTIAEWRTLIDYVGGLSIAGGKLKQAGLTHWETPNTDADNAFDFTALGAGCWFILINPDWSVSVVFSKLNQYTYFWAASPEGTQEVYCMAFDTGELLELPFVPATVPAYTPYFSVRLIKDAPALEGEPSGLTAVAYSATEMLLNWIRNTTDETGFRIERSNNGGTTFTQIGTVGAGVTTFIDNNGGVGLTPTTSYIYRVRAVRGDSLSLYSNLATGWTAMNFSIASAGNGSGLSKLIVELTSSTRFTISGTGKFYDDSAGTTNENTDRTYAAGYYTFYVKVPSGNANISIFSQNGLKGIDWDSVGLSNPNSPTVTAKLSELSTSITYFYIRGNNIVSGNISELSTAMTSLYCLGQNTISGDINHFQTALTSIILYGNNTLTGNISGLPSTLQVFDIGGLNTLSGNISSIPSSVYNFQAYGYNTLSGNLSGLKTGLINFGCTGYNTITGSLSGMPSTCQYFWVDGNNTLSGDISNIDSACYHISINGNNTISGNLSGIASKTALTYFYIGGSNTVTGDVSYIPTAMIQFMLEGNNTISGTLSSIPSSVQLFEALGQNTLSGNMNDLPANIYEFYVAGNSTISDYTSGHTWGNSMNYIYLSPVSGGLSSAEVDNLLIDLANSNWTLNGVQGGTLWIAGNNAGRTSASNSAVATLLSKNVAVTTNSAGAVSDYFLPSQGEMNHIYIELYLYGVGGFTNGIYWMSTEFSATEGGATNFASGLFSGYAKSSTHRVRACRKFTSSASFALRDIGQGGGLIFLKIDNHDGTFTYFETAPSDQSAAKFWSNRDSNEIGVTAQGMAVGDGTGNTAAIIGQAGHTDSAAKLCDDLVI
jgi:uncharacterized protein (TIGR02145 family)